MALPQAERATIDQDYSHPWVMRIQLIYMLHGPKQAAALARQAVAVVAPNKNLYSIYQLLGAALNHTGRDRDAIDACLEGASVSVGSSARLVEGALDVAAAMPETAELMRVHLWAEAQGSFKQQSAIARVLLHERSGAWREGAETARLQRGQYSNYFPLAFHEALSWLGADDPEEAQRALDMFPRVLRFGPRVGMTWLAAFVALRNGDVPRAAELVGIYLDSLTPPAAESIEAILLREWDHRVGTIGEANPALMAPVLPPSLTGLTGNTLRPQHGPPVLPQHRTLPASPSVVRRTKPRFLAVATEWRSGHGGLRACGVISASRWLLIGCDGVVPLAVEFVT
jgi:hypothetical protein